MRLSIALIMLLPVFAEGSLLRKCTCVEESECTEASLNETASCAAECGEALRPFGEETQKMVGCFEQLPSLIAAEQKCMRDKINTTCLKKGEFGTVQGTTLTDHNLTFTEPKKPAGGPFVQKAYEAFVTFKKFHFCIRHCLMEKGTKCFHHEGCGIDIPTGAPLRKWVDNCTAIYPQFYPLQLKACHCLLLKLRVSKLFGTCILIGNPSVAKNFGQEDEPFEFDLK